jgi:hypothetical protein
MKNLSLFKVAIDRGCVLYDSQDGRIVHTHRFVAVPGGREMTDEEIESGARACAQQAGHNIDGLRTLLVGTMDYEHPASYRVDTASKTLIKLEERTNAYSGPS